jgi:hypothetical protein
VIRGLESHPLRQNAPPVVGFSPIALFVSDRKILMALKFLFAISVNRLLTVSVLHPFDSPASGVVECLIFRQIGFADN